MLLNIRRILLCFQVVSGFNNNLTKLELVRFGDENDVTKYLRMQKGGVADKVFGLALTR